VIHVRELSHFTVTSAEGRRAVDLSGSCGVIEESSPLRGRVRLTDNMRFRESARRSFRTIGRVGPCERDFVSQSEIILWLIWANLV